MITSASIPSKMKVAVYYKNITVKEEIIHTTGVASIMYAHLRVQYRCYVCAELDLRVDR